MTGSIVVQGANATNTAAPTLSPPPPPGGTPTSVTPATSTPAPSATLVATVAATPTATRTTLPPVLVKRLADVNTRDPMTSETPLMMAVDKGWTDVVKAMLQAKADPNLKDNHSKTALMKARARGYSNIARLLINAGAKS